MPAPKTTKELVCFAFSAEPWPSRSFPRFQQKRSTLNRQTARGLPIGRKCSAAVFLPGARPRSRLQISRAVEEAHLGSGRCRAVGCCQHPLSRLSLQYSCRGLARACDSGPRSRNQLVRWREGFGGSSGAFPRVCRHRQKRRRPSARLRLPVSRTSVCKVPGYTAAEEVLVPFPEGRFRGFVRCVP